MAGESYRSHQRTTQEADQNRDHAQQLDDVRAAQQDQAWADYANARGDSVTWKRHALGRSGR